MLHLSETTVVSKPSFDEEIKTFKAVVRHIAKYEGKQGKTGWFQMDNRPNLRRLNDLGVTGHQPAIKAYCQITGQEKEKIVEASLNQKNGNNKKVETIYIESTGKRRKQAEATEKEKDSSNNEDKILLRKARFAIRGNRQMAKGIPGPPRRRKASKS